MNVREMFQLRPKDSVDLATEPLFGIECEIESCANVEGVSFTGFVTTTDGSLRNSGFEFISNIFNQQKIIKHFIALHAKLQVYRQDEKFSDRTSTHVHMNCRSLDDKHVRQLMLLYALYEPYFFDFASANRVNNIHCMPLTETHLVNYYRRRLDGIIPRWHKYTALNLLPLNKLGTVEFRHLEGTDDPLLLERWLTCLSSLWKLCQFEPITTTLLASPTEIYRLGQELFSGTLECGSLEYMLARLENNILDVKLAFI